MARCACSHHHMLHCQYSYAAILHYRTYIGKVNVDLAGAVDYVSNTFGSNGQHVVSFAKASRILRLPNW
jgi:hypothetical protein